MKKLSLRASEEQIENLYKSLKVGTPITIALQFAGISASTYYYWVAIYSVVLYCKEQDELEELEAVAQSGVSLQTCRDLAAINAPDKKTSMGTYIEPTAESILQYRNSRKFRKFADQVYNIIAKCNQIRSEVIMTHLQRISKSTTDRHINASGSMWFLERTNNEYFGRPVDKAKADEETPNAVPSVKVEFVDPNTPDSKSRLQEMEEQILNEMKGTSDA